MRAREAYRYLSRQQKRLRLEHWAISTHTHQGDHVHPSVQDQGQVVLGGICDVDVETLQATIHVGVYGDEPVVRETIRHEIVHLRLAEMEWVFEQAVSSLGDEAAEILRGSWSAAQERAVNAIAKALEDG